jgi:hypothetical protein
MLSSRGVTGQLPGQRRQRARFGPGGGHGCGTWCRTAEIPSPPIGEEGPVHVDACSAGVTGRQVPGRGEGEVVIGRDGEIPHSGGVDPVGNSLMVGEASTAATVGGPVQVRWSWKARRLPISTSGVARSQLPDRFPEFRQRCRTELSTGDAAEAVLHLSRLVRERTLALLTASPGLGDEQRRRSR